MATRKFRNAYMTHIYGSHPISIHEHLFLELEMMDVFCKESDSKCIRFVGHIEFLSHFFSFIF